MDPQTQSSNGPTLWRSLGRLIAGLAYLMFLALVFGGVTRVSILGTFLAVLVGTAFCTTLALVWLTRSALDRDGRKGQFGLGSLFFLTTFTAIYFGAVRWVVVHLAPSSLGRSNRGISPFVIVGAACLMLAACAIPFVVAVADSLVWFAVWLVRRPSIRRWLRDRRLPPGRQ